MKCPENCLYWQLIIIVHPSTWAFHPLYTWSWPYVYHNLHPTRLEKIDCDHLHPSTFFKIFMLFSIHTKSIHRTNRKTSYLARIEMLIFTLYSRNPILYICLYWLNVVLSYCNTRMRIYKIIRQTSVLSIVEIFILFHYVEDDICKLLCSMCTDRIQHHKCRAMFTPHI